ncbi:translation initiation factor IF-2-like [Apus apus]|uniref:translation initiation factor IF-2-like n=1 Tax=Apus apus TaxID=8895 RepID=UPI0021F8F977|nr:translation initiation factor IF-2-like [Apus apus]
MGVSPGASPTTPRGTPRPAPPQQPWGQPSILGGGGPGTHPWPQGAPKWWPPWGGGRGAPSGSGPAPSRSHRPRPLPPGLYPAPHPVGGPYPTRPPRAPRRTRLSPHPPPLTGAKHQRPTGGRPKTPPPHPPHAAPPPHLRLPCRRREAPAAGAARNWLRGAAPPALPRARIGAAAPLNGGAARSPERAAAQGAGGAARIGRAERGTRPHWLRRGPGSRDSPANGGLGTAERNPEPRSGAAARTPPGGRKTRNGFVWRSGAARRDCAEPGAGSGRTPAGHGAVAGHGLGGRRAPGRGAPVPAGALETTRKVRSGSRGAGLPPPLRPPSPTSPPHSTLSLPPRGAQSGRAATASTCVRGEPPDRVQAPPPPPWSWSVSPGRLSPAPVTGSARGGALGPSQPIGFVRWALRGGRSRPLRGWALSGGAGGQWRRGAGRRAANGRGAEGRQVRLRQFRPRARSSPVRCEARAPPSVPTPLSPAR